MSFLSATGNVPGTPQRISLSSSPKTIQPTSTAVPSVTAIKRHSAKAPSTASTFNKSEVIPVIVPRTDMASESKKEVGLAGRTMPFSLQSRASEFRRFPAVREEVDKPAASIVSDSTASKGAEFSISERNIFPRVTSSTQGSEKNSKDDRCVGSGKHETTTMTEPIDSSQLDSCKDLISDCLFLP